MTHLIKNHLSVWEYLFICVCTLYFIIPSFQAKYPFYIFLVIEVLYSFYLILQRRVNFQQFIKFTFLIIFVAFLYAVLTDAGSLDQNISNRLLKRFLSKLSQYSCMFFPLLFLNRCIIAGTRKQNIMLLGISLFAILMSCKPILELIEIDPMAARDFGNDVNSQDREDFIPAYPFVYAITFVFLCVSLFAKKIYLKFPVLKCLFGVFSLFFFYFLLKCQYTLSVITSILTLIIILYRDIKRIEIKILFLILFFLFLFFFSEILYCTIQYMPDMVANRLGEVYDLYTGNITNSDSDLIGRLDLYSKSISAFFDSPIWGNRKLDFDGHATYLMVWADLGILGGISVFSLLFMSKRVVAKLLGRMSFWFTPFFIHLLFNGFTNPIHASMHIYICLWFLIPLSLYVFSNKINL